MIGYERVDIRPLFVFDGRGLVVPAKKRGFDDKERGI